MKSINFIFTYIIDLLAMPCGKRDVEVVYEMGQSLAANNNQPHMVYREREKVKERERSWT